MKVNMSGGIPIILCSAIVATALILVGRWSEGILVFLGTIVIVFTFVLILAILTIIAVKTEK